MTEQEVKQKDKSQAQLDYEKGQGFLKDKDLGQAASSFHNALVGFEQENDESGIANASDKLGDVCLQKEDYDNALGHFERAYVICSKDTDRFSMFALEQKIAYVHDLNGNYEEAIKRYVDIIDEHNLLRNPQGAVDYLETLAGVYIKIKNSDKAVDCYQTIASIHKGYKHQDEYEKYTKMAEELESKGTV